MCPESALKTSLMEWTVDGPLRRIKWRWKRRGKEKGGKGRRKTGKQGKNIKMGACVEW